MRSFVFTLLFSAVLATAASAQFSVEGGVNFDNLAIKSAGTKVDTKMMTGGAFGLVQGVQLSDHIYFEPGLYYQSAGCNLKEPLIGGYSISTITIPLDIVYKSGDKCGNRFFAGAGPYIAKNLSGTFSMSVGGIEQSGSLKIGTGADANFKGTDLGINLTTGYKLKKHFYIRLRYQMGLVDLLPNGNSDNSIKTSSINLTLGYTFGRCREQGIGNLFKSHNSTHWHGMSKAKWSRRDRHPRYPQ
jgi:hypothetical protein